MRRLFRLPAVPALMLVAAFAAPGAAALLPSSFAPQVAYPTGSYPFSAVDGDFNHDGALDLAFASPFPTRATVLLNQGNGVFGSPVDYPTGSYSTAIATGDFNGDTHLDLAIANAQSNNVTVLLGTGTGSFGGRVDYGTGLVPYGIATADLDGDGDMDLVTADNGSNSLSVLRGNGDGTFGSSTAYPLPSHSRSVAIGDLNEDGHPDLVAGISGGSLVSVALGNGDGTFGVRQDLAVGLHPNGVAIGDIDVDGHLDIASANTDGGSVSVLLGAGDGSFAPAVATLLNLYPQSLAIGDLDGDSLPELAVAMVARSQVAVLQGLGAATLGPRLNFATGTDPFSVVIADLNSDEAPDMAVANEGGSTVSVLINTRIVVGAPTTTTIASDPSPSLYGQPVTLTATVLPDTVSGGVAFYEGGTLLGTAPLSAGVASLQVSNLAGGEHFFVAYYPGNAGFSASSSSPVPHLVQPAATTVTVAAAVNPSFHRQAIRFTATVTAVPPGGGTPTGTVQFKTDGFNIGAPVTLSAGAATSAFVDTLPVGPRAITAVYAPAVALNFAGATSEPLEQQVNPSSPLIVSVRDVPNDQGGKVFLTWRCGLDSPGIKIITGYRVWRRVPLPSGPATAQLLAAPIVRADGTAEETFWEAVAALPSAQLTSYGYTAATTQDSLAGGNPYTAFFVQALTADAFTSYSSPPDSGYSVDNLAPPAPASFVARYDGSGAALHWTPSRAPDVSFYRLHRGPNAGFVPGPENLVVAQPDTGYFDPAGSEASCYKLAAVDVHGNIGRWAIVTPYLPTAALASLVSAEVVDGHARLRWYVTSDEPLALAVQRRALDGPWLRVASAAQDGTGYVAFEDPDDLPGARYGYRLALEPVGGPAAYAGEAWLDLPLTEADVQLQVANPAVGGAVSVSFAAPAGRTTRLELFDMAGRVVASQSVPGGLGRRSFVVAGEHALAPGVYLLRVGLERPVSRRVVVIR